jgi:hypothetical protein
MTATDALASGLAVRRFQFCTKIATRLTGPSEISVASAEPISTRPIHSKWSALDCFVSVSDRMTNEMHSFETSQNLFSVLIVCLSASFHLDPRLIKLILLLLTQFSQNISSTSKVRRSRILRIATEFEIRKDGNSVCGHRLSFDVQLASDDRMVLRPLRSEKIFEQFLPEGGKHGGKRKNASWLRKLP